jgi:UPF0755 protein
MTDTGSFLDERPDTPAGGRRAERSRRRGPGCLIALVIVALLFGGLYYGLTKGVDTIRDQFSSSPDYPGPGTGSVTYEIAQGANSRTIGRDLKELDVVKSVDAFIEAATDNPASSKLQPGFYKLKKQMKASDALEVLVDPDNSIITKVTIPEGLRVVDVVDRLVDQTDFTAKQFQQALADPVALGLPEYANGNPEGYLFPATYEFRPGQKPADMLRAMVDRWKQAAEDADLEAAAAALDYTPHEMMTIASLIEAEGRGDYRAKIARVIYNRLEIDPNPAAGFLQIDATVNYALNRELVAVPTAEDLEVDSPYNTYKYKGLPPGPIEAPGDEAIHAALNPEDGPWFFYVTVNLETGETKFTDDYDEFLRFKEELREYCETQSDRC